MEDLNSKCAMWCGGHLTAREIATTGSSEAIRRRLLILEENDRELYFSLVGYEPKTAEIAIIGLNPAFTQLTNLCDFYQQTGDFDESRKLSAFSNAALRGNLVRMLDYLGLGTYLGLRSAEQFFLEEGRSKVLMTSVVKCASLSKDISKRSSDWDVLQYPFAVKCATSRLIYDLKIPSKLKLIVILGDKATTALRQIRIGSRSLYEEIEMELAPVIELPHPSGSNNENVLIFLDQKSKEAVRQIRRYQNCVRLRERGLETIREVFGVNQKT